MRVGLFDSGIGGLTVLKTLRNRYPHNDYIYYGDTLNVPYGDKTKDELLSLSIQNIDFLLSKKVDIIIIACGTVSSNCLKELKEIYNIPIYGIAIPTINYINQSNFNNICVIATFATINSHIFKNNINRKVYEIETPKLVPLIENNDLSNIETILSEYLNPYIDKIDLLVLGCTHYPIIKKNIKNIINKNITILDMSTLIDIPDNGTGTLSIYFSKLNNRIINNTKTILNDSEVVINMK